LFSPDVIFAPNARIIRNNGAPVVTMIQNMEPIAYDGINPFFEKAVNWARYREVSKSIHRSKRIIAISGFVKEHLINGFNVPLEKIGLIYLGTESLNSGNYMKPVTVSDTWAGKFLFTAGSIRPARGLEDLLNVLQHLNASEISGLAIAGEPSPRMQSYYQDLKSWVQRHGLSDKVCWTGHLNDQEMGWCYQNCYAFVMTSRVESFGMVGVEALSHGCVCIAANNPCLPEIFGESAFYYSMKDKGSLIKAIRSAADLTSVQRIEISGHAKKRALNFSWDACVEKIIGELKKAVENK